MNRKTKRTIIFICVAVLLIAALLCFLPLPTRVNLTLNAVKLDAEGNEIGTVQIPIQGTKWLSLFRQDRLDVTVGGFDDILPAQIDTSQLRKNSFEEYYRTTFGIVSTAFDSPNELASTSYTYTLEVCPKFDRWLILIRSGMDTKACYLGSISGNYTTLALLEYFNYSFN